MTNNITITGDLGSGKSSVTKILTKQLSFEVVSVGAIQRRLAAKYGMDATAFNIYMETHPEIDTECDNMVTELGKGSNLIFDSRLAWHFVEDSFKVYLSVDEDIAAKRIFSDKGRISESHSVLGEAKENIRRRRESELLRFKTQYGLQLDDFANYDLVIDTSYCLPDVIARCIIENYCLFLEQKPFHKIWISPERIVASGNMSDDNKDIISLSKKGNKFYLAGGYSLLKQALIEDVRLLSAQVD